MYYSQFDVWKISLLKLQNNNPKLKIKLIFHLLEVKNRLFLFDTFISKLSVCSKWKLMTCVENNSFQFKTNTLVLNQ